MNDGVDFRLLDHCGHGQAYWCDLCGGEVGEAAAARREGRAARPPLWIGPRPALSVEDRDKQDDPDAIRH